jgi:uncharacterized protein YceK
MLKKMLGLIVLPLLLSGCAATITNLTPQAQPRKPDHLYPVEVALQSRQQTIRWHTIRPQIVVGAEVYPMRPTPLLTNRWEGVIPVPDGTTSVKYRYKFDYDYNAMGKPQQDTFLSEQYTLKIK